MNTFYGELGLSQPPAKQTPTSQTMQLWQRATPIQKARTKFGPQELAEKHAKTANVTLLGEMARHGSTLSGDKLAGIDVLVKSLEAAQPAFGKKWDTIHALNDFFIGEFQSGSLRCFAFEAPRSFHSVPVEITPELWTAFPDWDKGEFKANGLHLIELRVLPSEGAPVVTYNHEQKLFGRPSIEEPVTGAFHALHALGKINTNFSMKSHYPLVRKWIEFNYLKEVIDANTISNEGIRGHFSPLFKALKTTNKQ